MTSPANSEPSSPSSFASPIAVERRGHQCRAPIHRNAIVSRGRDLLRLLWECSLMIGSLWLAAIPIGPAATTLPCCCSGPVLARHGSPPGGPASGARRFCVILEAAFILAQPFLYRRVAVHDLFPNSGSRGPAPTSVPGRERPYGHPELGRHLCRRQVAVELRLLA